MLFIDRAGIDARLPVKLLVRSRVRKEGSASGEDVKSPETATMCKA